MSDALGAELEILLEVGIVVPDTQHTRQRQGGGLEDIFLLNNNDDRPWRS